MNDDVVETSCLGGPETGRPWPLRAGDAQARGRALDVWFLRFDVAAFTLAEFDREGIALPESIRRSVAKRQAEFLAGRRAARRALQALGVDGSDAQLAIGRAREPMWPEGVVGSISHVEGLACAIACRSSRQGAVGLDIERIVDAQTRAALVETAFDGGELALLRQAGLDPGFDASITAAFSAKECLFKSAFPSVGRYFDFDAARLTALDWAAGRLVLTIVQSLGGGYEPGRQCEIHVERPFPGIVMTLSALPPEGEARS